jgi:hypothetical protein
MLTVQQTWIGKPVAEVSHDKVNDQQKSALAVIDGR